MSKEWTKYQCRKAALPDHRILEWDYINLMIRDAAERGENYLQLPSGVILTDEQETALVARGFSVSDITAPSFDTCGKDVLIAVRVYWIG
jgi:hypothetical protein